MVLLTNLISLHTHWLIAAGASPLFRNCFGRKMHWIRWGQWGSTIILLMVTIHALDCPSRWDLVRSTACQVLSIAFGLLSSLLCGGFRLAGTACAER